MPRGRHFEGLRLAQNGIDVAHKFADFRSDHLHVLIGRFQEREFKRENAIVLEAAYAAREAIRLGHAQITADVEIAWAVKDSIEIVRFVEPKDACFLFIDADREATAPLVAFHVDRVVLAIGQIRTRVELENVEAQMELNLL